ncbi:MAG: class I SAM-dependent methyltransferase [Candidatus Omnitrophota bacterium]|nr:class I SAM-dependent methyltransferase [Candidatus Omnitrophota bacterium]MBU1928493.1 class I SAM-dependent methyltransferase [Candidatus Omnitrophota bacterium]MBU2035434.1 class I SAM-dependent methyltransferase [Candidatus Omnitrophota bacterium]MBU2257949.1 class I SAM-dependent methyltransferase [Candidatus Omnitrophota bacterium]
MVSRLYKFFHRLISRPQEKGKYSAGNWQDKVRAAALFLCRDITAGQALEIGCGEGLFLTQLAKAHPGLECRGADNSLLRAEQAKTRIKEMGLNNAEADCQDAEKLEFADNYFDVVICINVFFNLPSLGNIKKVLTQVNRVTKKSGRLIFDIRNSANPALKIKYKLAPYYDASVKNLPLNTYSCAQIEGLLKEAGFTVENKLYLGFPIKAFAPLIVYQAKKND